MKERIKEVDGTKGEKCEGYKHTYKGEIHTGRQAVQSWKKKKKKKKKKKNLCILYIHSKSRGNKIK